MANYFISVSVFHFPLVTFNYYVFLIIPKNIYFRYMTIIILYLTTIFYEEFISLI